MIFSTFALALGTVGCAMGIAGLSARRARNDSSDVKLLFGMSGTLLLVSAVLWSLDAFFVAAE